MAEIVMPRLSDTMEEGTILRWLIRNGEPVSRGEELVEIETDKASMTYESDQSGVLEIIAGDGETLAVGEPIARVLPAGGGAPPERPEAPRVQPLPVSPEPAGDAARTRHLSVATTPQAPIAPQEAQAPAGARPKASPLARRIAREQGVPLAGIPGSGPGGRIVRADVEAAGRAPAPPQAPAPEPSGEAPAPDAAAAAAAPAVPRAEGVLTAKGETTVYELSRTQQLIARRMAESKATIPHFSLEAEIDMEECVALRSELARHLPAGTGGEAAAGTSEARGAGRGAPSFNDMIVKACAIALREHPRANGTYRDGSINLHARVNVGVAVAVQDDDPLRSALVVPTIFDADIKSLGEIAREARALAARVRSGEITPPELSGGTFTVSNLGMYGVRRFSAIVNPPQAAILAVGELAPRPVLRDGAITARHTMDVTLACDHRLLYGADAARFLARVAELLEAPASLLL